jgi:hypothetical protein
MQILSLVAVFRGAKCQIQIDINRLPTAFLPSYPLTILQNTTYKLDATIITLPTSYPFRDALPNPTSSVRCTNLPMLYLWRRHQCQIRHFLRPYVH